jgi:hypothetical protein
MRLALFALAVVIVAPNFSSASGRPPRLEFIGTFSAFRQTPEHVYGYQLTLWTDDGTPHALWARAQGEPADFPIVRVTDLLWDSASGTIQFTARWCDGTEVFRGKVGRDVRGTLAAHGRSENLTLRRGDTASMGKDQRAEWEAFVSDELKRRQPKC